MAIGLRKDVREVLDLCKGLGLDPVMESGSGHFKVRDPSTGVYLFGISSSPSDPNWRWMIMRHLRRLGLIKRDEKRERRRPSSKRGKSQIIDIGALKKAQDAAASAGERIPTLDDLDEHPDFFRRGNLTAYTDEASQEVIDNMAARADAPRIAYLKGRLRKVLETHDAELQAQAREKNPKIKHGQGARSEFVRIAINEVAKQRNIRAWKTEASGQQTLMRFLDDPKSGLQVWAADLIDATMDHIEGLKWNEIDESRKHVHVGLDKSHRTAERDPKFTAKVVEPEPEYESDKLGGFAPAIEAQAAEEVTVPEIPGEVILEETTENHIRERYAEALLEILKAEGSNTAEPVLNRLDKLAGIA